MTESLRELRRIGFGLCCVLLLGGTANAQVTATSSSAPAIAKFSSPTSITNSSITDNGTTVNVNENFFQIGTTTLQAPSAAPGGVPSSAAAFNVTAFNGQYPLLASFKSESNSGTALQLGVGNGATSLNNYALNLQRIIDGGSVPAAGAGIGVNFTIANSQNSGYEESSSILSTLTSLSSSGNTAALIFQTEDVGSDSEKMRITGLGKVGIGTPSPGAKLEVNGGITMTYNPSNPTPLTFADGTVQTTAYTGTVCGGDYAESVDVTGNRRTYEPGDVLVISSDDKGDVAKSTESYSTAVVGIYSTKPGTVGRRQTGAKSPDEVPMAMIGIVPTKVSAENGPIHRGDLLVTSSTMGYAMKGTDRGRMLGAVVGKALGSLESGKGVIEVVVTLQ